MALSSGTHLVAHEEGEGFVGVGVPQTYLLVDFTGWKRDSRDL